MRITQPESLTGIRVCPKCKNYCLQVSKGNNDRFEKHVKNCSSGDKGKKSKFDKVPSPYCPHITKNERYRQSLINNTTQTPKQSYIIFDIETVKKIMNKQIGKSTTINGELEMLSVSYCVRSQNQESITHYFDKQQDDFMKLFFESLFKSTEQVSIDNQ